MKNLTVTILIAMVLGVGITAASLQHKTIQAGQLCGYGVTICASVDRAYDLEGYPFVIRVVSDPDYPAEILAFYGPTFNYRQIIISPRYYWLSAATDMAIWSSVVVPLIYMGRILTGLLRKRSFRLANQKKD